MKYLEKIKSELLIIIPARGNSTRLKNKNIFNLGEKKLIEFTFDLLKNNNLDKQAYVSTDSKKIINVARKNNIKFIKRPKNISTKNSSVEAAVIHAIKHLDSSYKKYKWVLTLAPTSPLRKINLVYEALKMANKEDFDSIISLTLNRGDFWLKKNNKFKRLFPNAPRRQQQRDFLYEETSSLYLNNVSNLIKTKSLINGKIGGVISDNLESLDINNLNDINFLKSIKKIN